MKAKSKSHPFVGLLDADEEILWSHTSWRPTWKISLIHSYKLFIGCVLLFFACPGITILESASSSRRFEYMISVWVMAGILSGIIAFFFYPQWRPAPLSLRAYALTNKRLLSCTSDTMTILHLEEIEVRPDSGSGEILSSGILISAWRGIPDAEDVLHLIALARANRLDDLKKKRNV